MGTTFSGIGSIGAWIGYNEDKYFVESYIIPNDYTMTKDTIIASKLKYNKVFKKLKDMENSEIYHVILNFTDIDEFDIGLQLFADIDSWDEIFELVKKLYNSPLNSVLTQINVDIKLEYNYESEEYLRDYDITSYNFSKLDKYFQDVILYNDSEKVININIYNNKRNKVKKIRKIKLIEGDNKDEIEEKDKLTIDI